MNTPTKKQLEQLARKHKAELEWGRDEIVANAKEYFTFRCSPGVHSLVSSAWENDFTMAELRQDMYERLAMGTEYCTCSECDP